MLKSAFIRENFVAVLGVALPLILVAAFALVRVVASVTVPAPQFMPVYAVNEIAAGGHFNYDVGPDQNLAVTFTGPKYSGSRPQYRVTAKTTIYVMDPKTGAARSYAYTVSDAHVKGTVPVASPDMKTRIVAQGALAPDGYAFVNGNGGYYSGGIVPEIFFGYRYDHNNARAISKGGRSFVLPPDGPYTRIEFIGWAKE